MTHSPEAPDSRRTEAGVADRLRPGEVDVPVAGLPAFVPGLLAFSGALRRLVLVVVAYYAIFGYSVLRTAWLIAPDWQPGAAVLAALLVGPAGAWLAFQRHRNPLTRALYWGAYQWLGACWILLGTVLCFEAVNLLVALPQRLAGQGILWLALGQVAVAAYNANRVRTTRIQVHSERLDRPYRLVQLSDVHIGSRRVGFLRRIARRVRALEPDAVLVTGDLVDHRGVTREQLAPLAELGAPVWLSLGNHERYVDCDAVCGRLDSLGVRVLRDAVDHFEGLRLIGIDDAPATDTVARRLDRLDLKDAPGRPFTILLYHRPEGFEDAARRGVDLMLAGHTHGGQIVPFNWVVRRVHRRISGRHEAAGAVLYVSQGTGTWGPTMRLGTRSEVVSIELRPGHQEAGSEASGSRPRDRDV